MRQEKGRRTQTIYPSIHSVNPSGQLLSNAFDKMTSLRGPGAGSGPGAGRPLMMRQRWNQDNNQDHWAVAGVWRPATSHACFTVYWFHLACEEWRGQPLEIPWSPPRESSSIWANLQIICMCGPECACPWHVNFCKKKGVPPSYTHCQDFGGFRHSKLEIRFENPFSRWLRFFYFLFTLAN